jgi:acetoin utilization deacetylase AcuC-like enzyme
MRAVYSQTHRLHDPRRDVDAGVAVEHRERPARADTICEALAQDGSFEIEPPTDHGRERIEAVHENRLISYLESAWQTWRATRLEPDMVPDTILLPGLRVGIDQQAPEPEDPIGRLGYWCFDTGTPIGPGTYQAARAAVDVALTATDLVLGGERAAYALCRPPGHHAAHAAFGGFCYFNNAAIAAEYLVRSTGSTVAVLDLDFHHGNGTQQIFYRRSDVVYVSLHADPRHAYPYFTGYAEETGSGPGAGCTLNLPLPANTDDAHFLEALDEALEFLVRIRPAITVVSFGVDTYKHDPLGDFSLTTEVYGECGQRLGAALRPVVVLQEGGYYLPDLGENVRRFLLGINTS